MIVTKNSTLRCVILSLLIACLLTGCANPNKNSAASPPKSTQQAVTISAQNSQNRAIFKEVGIATYYGDSVNGHKTANGDIFDNKKFTAAHKTLPFGTYVKVTALWNGKSTTVKITDRGPYRKGRIIDISKAAAAEIGLVGKGLGKVEIEVVNNKN